MNQQQEWIDTPNKDGWKLFQISMWGGGVMLVDPI